MKQAYQTEPSPGPATSPTALSGNTCAGQKQRGSVGHWVNWVKMSYIKSCLAILSLCQKLNPSRSRTGNRYAKNCGRKVSPCNWSGWNILRSIRIGISTRSLENITGGGKKSTVNPSCAMSMWVANECRWIMPGKKNPDCKF